MLLIAGVAQPVLAQPVPSDDPEFSAALPPLDATAAPAAPAPPPAAPATDPELAAPLPSIATFDATPPPPTAADTSEETSKIRYRLELSGLKQVDLETQFRALSTLVKGDKAAANAAQVTARANEDVKLVERLLRSQGYYDGSAAVAITPDKTREGRLVVAITATPGMRYDLGAIAVTGPDTVPPALPRTALGLQTGQPIVADIIQGAEANVSLRLPQQGYPFVNVGARDILLDPASHRGDYTLPVDPGPRSSFGGFQTAGDPVFDPKHISLLSRFKPGELYDSRRIEDLRQALVATSLFSTVAVEPVRTGKPGPDGTEQVDLLVRQSKGPWRTLAGQAGYQTGEGIKLQGSWTNRNLFPPEGALTLTGVAGTEEQRVGATFRRSNAGKRDRSVQAGIEVSRERREAYDAQSVTLNASISRASTPIWQKKWTYSFGPELVATRESRFQQSALDRTKNTYIIAALPGQLGYDGSDNLLDPHRGFRVTGRVSPEAQKRSGGGFDGYARLLLEGSTYYPLMDSLVVAGRARFGSIVGVSRDDVAPSRRYYAGGGGSVRGFGFQELGPRDANNDPLGGRGLTEFALEARYRFGNYGVAPFVDAGQLRESSTPGINDLRTGVGIGGRYYTNFGPLRVDIATPLARRPGESKISLYFSIGQAF